MGAKKPFYKRGKFWKWSGIYLLGLVLVSGIYDATPAGKRAAEELRLEEVAKAEAAEAKKVARAEKRAKVDAEIAAEIEAQTKKEAAKAKEDEKAAEKATAMAALRDENIPIGLAEIVDKSDGVVVSIDKQPGRDDWGVIKVVVSDAWYESPEHEKERFAEVFGSAVKSIVGTHDGTVLVNYYDTYDKELATEKIFGGWKIKR